MINTKMKKSGNEGLPEMIRKEIGAETNRRFLARMPDFRLDEGIPEKLRALLRQMDNAEANARHARD